jgi:uncharacterized membrane-anchored protein YhcB (DUF1043 family)
LFAPGVNTNPQQNAAEQDKSAEMGRSAQSIADDLAALKSSVESMRVALVQSQGAQSQIAKDQHALEKSLDGLKTKLDALKAETSASINETAGKLEQMQRDPIAKLQQAVERLDHIAHQASASATPVTTASNRTQIDATHAKPPVEHVDAPKSLPLITSWVVRDVYDGLALVENARGSLEVALGETIPGAGTVKSIERRGGGWIVITNRGRIDFARDTNMFP